MAARKSSNKRNGTKANDNVAKAMHERKRGTLKSGSGQKVTSKKQAIAIGLSEARKEGGKAPKKAAAKKPAAKKPAMRKPAAKKPARKPAAKKPAAKKSTAKKATARRRAPKR